MELLSPREVEFVARKWIGVSGGYLGDFSYRTHHEFYPDYCDIEDIDPYKIEGTTRVRFEHILKTEAPARQALILRGVLKKFPDPADKAREAEHRQRMQDLIARCEGGVPIGAVKPTARAAYSSCGPESSGQTDRTSIWRECRARTCPATPVSPARWTGI